MTLLLAASMMVVPAVMSSALPALAQGGAEILFFLDDPSACPSAAFPGGSASMAGCATVTSIKATGTPQNSGETLQCFACTINFETGPLTGSDPTHWFFGAGAPGSVVMAGMIEDKNGDVEPLPGDLLTGTLDPSTVTESGSMATFSGQFTGALSSEGFEELNEFYGITSMLFSNSLALTFGIAAAPDDAVVGGEPFVSNPDVPFSGMVVATPITAPEPPAAFLLGFSLLALACSRRPLLPACGPVRKRKRGLVGMILVRRNHRRAGSA